MEDVFIVPDWAIIVGSALFMGCAILGMPHLVQRLPWINPTPQDTDFVIRMQGTLFTLLGLLMAFTLVQTESYNRKAEVIISNEASQINRMDRLLARYGTDEATALRPHLLAYTRSIVDDEWSVMLDGQRSERTYSTWNPLSHGLLKLSPANPREAAIFGELLKSLNEVVEARDQRLSTALVRLPPNYWILILFGVLMLLIVSSTLEPSAFRSTNMVAQMATLGALLGFLFVQDQPFLGGTSVGPGALIRAMDAMQARVD